MAVRWIPFAFCTEGGPVGWIIVTLLAYYKYAWFLFAGMTQANPKLWMSFVLLYGQFEELFFNWVLSYQFQQDRPECTLEYDATFEQARNTGMPSLETQLSFALSSFVLCHFLITDSSPSVLTIVLVVVLPFVVGSGLYITSNNTALQVLIGALLGTANGIKRIFLYHYFAKQCLLALIDRYPFLRAFLPSSD